MSGTWNDSEDPPAAAVIELVALSKSYFEAGRRRVVLDRADGVIARGELVVLLGRSGSGKSTLLHLIAGIDRPDSGDVLLEGRSLSGLPDDERTRLRRDRLGFVFQFFNLVPTLTVEENLLLPLELSGRSDRASRGHALDLLAEVGLGDRRSQFPDRLSGGEQQRVAIARALANDPALVLADEPTGNLDLETGLEVIEILDRLTRRAGKTLLMVTHGREVMGIADRVLALEEGKLVERANHDREAGGTVPPPPTSGRAALP
ncbi:MAG: ABC transporter ATP-binding protein [Thermoanaerobaculia bacterium]